MVTTDALGRYEFPQLPAGEYYLCMEAPGYLTNCEWAQYRLATVALDQVLDLGIVQLTKAVTVTIRINDPLSLLTGTSAVTSPLAVGVGDRFGRFHPARATGVNGSIHAFQVDVPFAAALNVWLYSWKFLLTDSASATLNPQGARIPFQVAVTTGPPRSRSLSIPPPARNISPFIADT